MKVLSRLKKVEPGRILGGALGLLLVLTLVFALAPPAMAIPQLAHRFDGSVTINLEPAAEGVEVSATIAGVDEVFTATTDAGGEYHLLYVRGDDPNTPEKEGGNNGDEIEFYVDDVYVISYTFESGASTTLNLTVTAPDTTPPTVELTSTASDLTNISPIPMTATFSETVTGFVVGDITVGNGAAGNFVAVSGTVYTFDVTPTADGAVTVDTAAGVATDAAGNPNEAATQFSITYDSTAPTVTDKSPAADATEVAVDAAVTATFGEDVLEGALGDITITGATGVSATLSEATDTITIAHDAFDLGTSYTVTIPAGAVDDLAGNPLAEAEVWSFTTEGAVIVSIDAPTQALPDSTFTANVDIGEVVDFDACNYDVSFDALVLELTSVTSGLIDSTTIPVSALNEISSGTWTIVQNVPGTDGVSGSGYLAVLNFHVIGAAGTSSTITLSNGMLGNNLGVEIPSAWTGDSVSVVAVTYSLTMAVVGEGTVTPGSGDYAAGDMAITATPASGWEFSAWSTDDMAEIADASSAETTLTLDKDKTVTATFTQITYTLTVASSDNGSVTTPGENTFPYNAGTVVSLVAVPDDGYEFVNWTGDVGTVADVNAASTTITMSGNYSITANFALIGVTYDLTVASTDGGSVTTPGEGTFPYNAGTVVSLVAVPDDGYEFVNWTGDVSTVADVNAASTTITMNGDYSITANFMASLGDLIDETPPGGTIDLPPGTYSGGTIDKPITLTGTEGTIISGGITIGELTGSDVTIENLTITGYTDFGLKIIKVRPVDTFIIRNNTFQGVSGSIIGIEVDEVQAGGILTIERNSITGNETGIKLLAAVADGAIQFNDITGNTTGLEMLAVGSDANASYNWWADISGPEEATNNPGGVGNAVVGSIEYQPWLTRVFQTALDDNIAYFGFAWVNVSAGWNIISTPIALDPSADTWGEYVALGDGLDVHATSPAYYFNSQTQAWVALTSSYALNPCDALYIRMASADTAPILYSPNLSVPSRELYAGWNLVGLAYTAGTGLKANETLVSVAEVTGGLTGYKLVVSPSLNPSSWIYSSGAIADWDGEGQAPDGWMLRTYGYWVFMLNDGTLAGFTFTPVSLGM